MLGDARRRAAALGVQQLRSLSVSGPKCALPVTQQQNEGSGGWLAGLFGAGRRESVPMSEPLPGVQLPSPYSPPSQPPATETSRLGNGLIVAAENTPVMPVPRHRDVDHPFAWLTFGVLQGPTATLGLYVNAGSSYEKPGQTGVNGNLWVGLDSVAWDSVHGDTSSS